MPRPVLPILVLLALAGAIIAACSDGGSSGSGTGTSGVTVTDAGSVHSPGSALDGGTGDIVVPEVIGCDAGATDTGGCGCLDVTLSGGFTASDCCYGCGGGTRGFSWMIDQDRAP
ncbi:MAG: hypothetical protein ACREJ3_19170, partial [Polyangiaceae bacterium]